MSTAEPLYVNDALREMTKNARLRDRLVMMSSVIPSEKYSCSASPLILAKGRTAIDGFCATGRAGDAATSASLIDSSASAPRSMIDICTTSDWGLGGGNVVGSWPSKGRLCPYMPTWSPRATPG